MASDNTENGTNWAGVVKWIVIGIVAITALFLFKGEIGRFLERTEDVEISSSGLKIKTSQTLLGVAEVSSVSVKASEGRGQGILGNSYVSHQQDFQIAWPDRGGWSASEAKGKALATLLELPATVEVPLVIMRDEAIDDFLPNVNVIVENIGNISPADYFNLTIQGLQQQNWQILTKDFDETTQGGFISFYNTTANNKLYQFQRVAVSNGKAYVITASQLPPEDSLSENLRKELLTILNSFRLIDLMISNNRLVAYS